jgi:hypothetical protein
MPGANDTRRVELPILSNRAQPKTAFVFAGGGSFGAIQVGMLHALAAHGIVAAASSKAFTEAEHTPVATVMCVGKSR